MFSWENNFQKGANMIITIANAKGGVKKTTTAVSVAHGLAIAQPEASILIGDIDPQGHVATSLGLDTGPEMADYIMGDLAIEDAVRTTKRPSLHLVRGNSRLRRAQVTLQSEVHGVDDAKARIRLLAAGFDYTIFDTAPSGLFQEILITLANILIIPVTLEELPMDGMRMTLLMARQINQAQQIIILPTALDKRLSEHKLHLARLLDAYSASAGPHLSLPIPQRVAVTEAVAAAQTIWEYESEGIADVRFAYGELLDLVARYRVNAETTHGAQK
jgi:chromosome partitioning protein